MKKQDAYYWRLVATAFSFFSFGIGGLFLWLALPLVGCLGGDKRKKIRRARKVIHKCFRFFIAEMKFFGLLTCEVKGYEKLGDGRLVVANHPTLIDVVVLISFIENANCIVKHSLFNNPFTRGPVKSAGYIANTDGPALIRNCVACLDEGDTLIVFPEGTRTPVDAMPRFQRGAANIALAAKTRPLMVTIKFSTPFLGKGVKWYDIPHCRPHLCFDISEMDDLPELAFNPKSARRLTEAFRDYFLSKGVYVCQQS